MTILTDLVDSLKNIVGDRNRPTIETKMNRDNVKRMYPRLEDALWRGWNEIHFAINARKLLLEIYEPHQEKLTTRKGIIYSTLDDNIRMRLARLLEPDLRAQSAGFDYVKRCCPNQLAEVAGRYSLDLKAVDDFACRLKTKRDLTFFHIDKKAIGRSAEIWQEEPLKYRELDQTLEALRIIYKELYLELTGEEAPYFDLEGELPKIRDGQE